MLRCGARGDREVTAEKTPEKGEAAAMDSPQNDSGNNPWYHSIRVVRLHWSFLRTNDQEGPRPARWSEDRQYVDVNASARIFSQYCSHISSVLGCVLHPIGHDVMGICDGTNLINIRRYFIHFTRRSSASAPEKLLT